MPVISQVVGQHFQAHMLRRDIKSFIKAIRRHQNDVVASMLDQTPGLIGARAKSPPKKDDGQSPLQIAFKVGNFRAARLLLDNGADPTFIEDSAINEWRAPVLHDAIRATIFSTTTLEPNTVAFVAGLNLLERMLTSGADPNQVDSFGNSCGMRAVLDARLMISHPGFDDSPKGTVYQVRQVFDLLARNGADFYSRTDERESVTEAVDRMGLSKYQLLPNNSLNRTPA